MATGAAVGSSDVISKNGGSAVEGACGRLTTTRTTFQDNKARIRGGRQHQTSTNTNNNDNNNNRLSSTTARRRSSGGARPLLLMGVSGASYATTLMLLLAVQVETATTPTTRTTLVVTSSQLVESVLPPLSGTAAGVGRHSTATSSSRHSPLVALNNSNNNNNDDTSTSSGVQVFSSSSSSSKRLEEEPSRSGGGNAKANRSSSMNIRRGRLKRRTRLTANVLPEFSSPIANVTAIVGRDVRLVCTVDNLGQYQVAWLKEETKTILSIDVNIITTNYRIYLIPDEEEKKWVLHIRDVQESDRGFYQCQINTIPMRTTSGYLEVVVPPKIIESQSSNVAEVLEYSNVSLQCKADGHPRPVVSWRRDDGTPIRLNGKASGNHVKDLSSESGTELVKTSSLFTNSPLTDSDDFSTITTSISSFFDDVKSDKLTLYDVDKSMAGIYACTASNGVSSQATKKIPLYVKFTPKTSIQNKYVSVTLGEPLEIDCLIEAFPKANSYWSKKPTSNAPINLAIPIDKQTSSARWSLGNSNRERGAISWQRTKPAQISEEVGDNSSSRANQNLKQSTTNSNNSQSYSSSSLTQPPAVFMHHPHNRIQFRQADYSRYSGNNNGLAYHQAPPPPSTMNPIFTSTNEKLMFNKDDVLMFDQTSKETPSLKTGLLSPVSGSNGETEASTPSVINQQKMPHFTVKPTAINSYTYKLKLIISKMRPEYLGEYTCTSTNTMGTSVSSVIVTVEKISEKSRGRGSDLDENEFQQHASNNIQQRQANEPLGSTIGGGGRRSSNGNHVVYDENYLQAIKFRQQTNNGGMMSNNNAASGRLSQKLKKHSDRNTAFIIAPDVLSISIIMLTFVMFSQSSYLSLLIVIRC